MHKNNQFSKEKKKEYREKKKTREFFGFSWVFFQVPKVIESAHTLLHYHKDNSKDQTKFGLLSCISQIIIYVYFKGTI